MGVSPNSWQTGPGPQAAPAHTSLVFVSGRAELDPFPYSIEDSWQDMPGSLSVQGCFLPSLSFYDLIYSSSYNTSCNSVSKAHAVGFCSKVPMN